jgi:hypothetical protein
MSSTVWRERRVWRVTGNPHVPLATVRAQPGLGVIRSGAALSPTEYDFGNSFRRGGCGDRRRFVMGTQDARPRIECRHPSSNEFVGISCDHNQIFQGSNRRDEKVWLSKGVATLLSFDHHGFPADNNVLCNGVDAVGEQRPKRSVNPKMNFSAAAHIFELLDSKPDFAERDFDGEKQFARLSGDELRDGSSRFRSAKLRYDVGIEEPTPHSLTSRTGDLMVIRSKIHASERGRGQRGYDIATGNRPPHAIEFIRSNYHYRISAVQCDTLRASLLGLAHHFAQARLRVLKTPAVARSRPARLR